MKAWWRKREVNTRVGGRRVGSCPRVLVTLASTDDGDPIALRGSASDSAAITLGSPYLLSEEEEEGEEEEEAEDSLEGTAERSLPCNFKSNNGSVVSSEDAVVAGGPRCSVVEEHEDVGGCWPPDRIQGAEDGGGRHPHGTPDSIEANTKKSDKRFRLDSFGKSLSRCAFYIGDNGTDLENLVLKGDQASGNCAVDISPTEERTELSFPGRTAPCTELKKSTGEVAIQVEQESDLRSQSHQRWSEMVSRHGGTLSLAEARVAFRESFSKLTSPEIFGDGVPSSINEASTNLDCPCDLTMNGDKSMKTQKMAEKEHALNPESSSKSNEDEVEPNDSLSRGTCDQSRNSDGRSELKHLDKNPVETLIGKRIVKHKSRRKSMESGSNQDGPASKMILNDSTSLSHQSTRQSLRLDIPPVQNKHCVSFSKVSPPSLDLLHIPEPQTAPPSVRNSLLQSLLSPPTSTPQELGASTSSQDTRKFSFPILRRHSHTTLHNSESMASITFRSIVGFIQEDNLQGLQNFLENKRVLVDDRDENGTTPLMVAATKGKLTFVRELLNHGAEANAEDGDNWSALLCAAKEGHTDIVSMLLDQGATLEHRDMGGWTALMWACYKGRTETAHLLLEKGADVAAHGNYHIPSLLWAAGRGHTQIVNDLLAHGAKPNIADKYGTSALVWACRKGHLEIVEALLRAGANVDAAGMYSWTPLLVATIGGYSDVVHRLLEHRPNTNAVDTDGCTALTHACKDGHMPIVIALLNAGAYINIQDRAGDTNLIHAVKGGHRGVVESLLKKYADVDIPGKDHKTAAYWAVEKNNAPMLRILLTANPDLEIATKDGDTALLRAVRVRSIELVQLLLDKKAKVTAADKKGDTALHIAMRARSKGIVEVLLRNPKNSQLLYRPNRASETPYNIDMSHQKTILSQIYGARRLNTSEDSEAMLGYDLYSSALADILSEPSLSLPITVGLYARWGSGKSFLLSKLREEMNNFARQWVDPVFQFSSMLFLAVCNIAMIGGAITGLASRSWIAGVSTGGGIVAITYGLLLVVWYGSQRYDWYWPYNLNSSLTRKLNSLKLVLQVMFCHPPGDSWSESLQAQPIRFYFSENTRVSNTTGGESSVVQMVASLYDAIEADYGAIPTRLYRAFRPRPLRATSSWRWRRVCCLPYVVIVVFTMMCFVALALCLSIYLRDIDTFADPSSTERVSLVSTMSALGAVILVSILVNLRTWGRMAKALIFPHRTHLQRALRAATSGSSSGDSPSLRTGGFLHALRAEVATMTEMVRCLDGFCAQQQSRLVAIVDGLDACEQEKVLLVMDAVQVLVSQAEVRQAVSPSAVASSSGGGNQSNVSSSTSVPFIIILAIDPHVISRALEINLRRYGNEWGPGGGLSGIITGGTSAATTSLGPGNVGLVGGMAYLRNIVHLPFFLQSSGPRRLRAAAALRQHGNRRRNLSECIQDEHSLRRLSTESGLSHTDRQRLSERSSVTGERLRRKGTISRLLPSESICSSLGSNLNRAGGSGGGGPFDLSKVLLADDYFSDVNPRSMRRLMNIVHVTGRLLKAFQVDFSWYHLANWVNVTEQWPFRISFLGLYCETHPNYEADAPLKEIYDQIKDQIPAWREVCPLVDLDREERKFDVFLTYHKASLHFADLQLFLPFTINLDPYIKKVIREEQQNMEDLSLPMMPAAQPHIIGGQWPVAVASHQPAIPSTPLPWSSKSSLIRRNRTSNAPKVGPPPGLSVVGPGSTMIYPGGNQWTPSQMGWNYMLPPQEAFLPTPRPAPITTFPPELMEMRLSAMSVSAICELIGRLPDITPALVPIYQETMKENNLSGRVILHCDLDDLKKVLKMNFGDWELFRMLVVALREQECVSVTQTDEVGLGGKYVRFASSGKSHVGEGASSSSSSPRPYYISGSNHSSQQLQYSSSKPSNLGTSEAIAVVHNVPSVSVTSPSSEQLSYNNPSISSPNVDPALITSQVVSTSASGKSIESIAISGSPVMRTSSTEVTRVPSVMEMNLNQDAGWESQSKDLQASKSFTSSTKGSASTKSIDNEPEGRNPKLATEQRSQGGSLSYSSSSPPVSISGISSPPQMWLSKQQSQLEKQVMMEEEMICEALQALNQDALTDVLDEEGNTEEEEEEEGSINEEDSMGPGGSIKNRRGELLREEHIRERGGEEEEEGKGREDVSGSGGEESSSTRRSMPVMKGHGSKRHDGDVSESES